MANNFMANVNKVNVDGVNMSYSTTQNVGAVGSVESNKDVTIVVKDYTDPVVVTPTSPNTAMGSVTVTLDTTV